MLDLFYSEVKHMFLTFVKMAVAMYTTVLNFLTPSFKRMILRKVGDCTL